MIELRPCPFCGGRAELNEHTGYGWRTVQCVECCASTSEAGVYTAAEAAARWNRRAADQPAAVQTVCGASGVHFTGHNMLERAADQPDAIPCPHPDIAIIDGVCYCCGKPVASTPTPQPAATQSITKPSDMNAAFGPADGSGNWLPPSTRVYRNSLQHPSVCANCGKPPIDHSPQYECRAADNSAAAPCGHIWVYSNSVCDWECTKCGRRGRTADNAAAQPAAAHPNALAGEAGDARLGRIAMRFVDRAGDYCEVDPAERICDEFSKAMGDEIERQWREKMARDAATADNSPAGPA